MSKRLHGPPAPPTESQQREVARLNAETPRGPVKHEHAHAHANAEGATTWHEHPHEHPYACSTDGPSHMAIGHEHRHKETPCRN